MSFALAQEDVANWKVVDIELARALVKKVKLRLNPREWSYSVQEKNNKVFADAGLKKIPKLAFDVSLTKENGRFTEPTLASRVENGWLLAYNYGEFGHQLWWHSDDGMARRKISDDAVNSIKKVNGKIYACLGIHLEGFPTDGAICEIQEIRGEWKMRNRKDFKDAIILDVTGLPSGRIALLANYHLLLEQGNGFVAIQGFERDLTTSIDLCSDSDGNLFLGGILFVRKFTINTGHIKLDYLVCDAKRLRQYEELPEDHGFPQEK